MATKIYLPASAAAVPISPTPSASWNDTSILVRAKCSTSKIGDALTTVSFGDTDVTDKNILYRQYICQPAVGTVFSTISPAFNFQCRISETAAGNNLFLALGVRVIASDGTTVQATIFNLTRGATEAATSLTNRRVNVGLSASYTIVAGDYLVIEIGVGGDPSGGGPPDHDSSMRLGDSAATDLGANETDTTDLNPYVEFVNNFTIIDDTLFAQALC